MIGILHISVRFLYYEKVHLTADNVTSVMYAAKKYLVSPLIIQCRRYLEDAVNETEVCTILQQSLRFSEEELTGKCLRFVQNRTSQVFKQADATEISEEILALIAVQNKLNIDEIDLFEYCIEWAKTGQRFRRGASLRQTLGSVLRHIRFPTMSLDAFSHKVVPLDVLTTDETRELYRYLTATSCKEDRPTTRYSTLNRKPVCSILTLTGSVYREQQLAVNGGGQKYFVNLTANGAVKLDSLYFISGQVSSRVEFTIKNLHIKRISHTPVAAVVLNSRGPLAIEYFGDTLEHEGAAYKIGKLDLTADGGVVIEPGSYVVEWAQWNGECRRQTLEECGVNLCGAGRCEVTFKEVTMSVDAEDYYSPFHAVEFDAVDDTR